jgi:hypothetical protein
VAEAIQPLAGIEPPPDLASELSSSPCRRWLGLLYTAVDREITEGNLERLLGHLESCPACRRAWNDLTLIHQIGTALEPPPGLLQRCLRPRARPLYRVTMGRRAAAAAAYVLAAASALMIGNPVSIARSPVVQQVADTVSSEVREVAIDGRGEIRVALWRAWRWASRQIDTLQEAIRSDEEPEPGQGESHEREQ